MRALERISTVTLVGVRFCDAVTGTQIRDGLRVQAWPAGGGRRATAFRTASDVYAFQGFPRLEDIETGRKPLDFDASPGPQPQPFVLSVEDSSGRWLPVALRFDLPLTYPGRYLEGAPTMPGAEPVDGLRLFRAPASRAEHWMARIRGELLEQDSDRPAAHARVRVRIDGGPPTTGFADAAGRFLLVAPLPALIADLGSSPPVVPTPLSQRTWHVALSVNWEPGVQASLFGTDIPDYETLFIQAPVDIWTDTSGPVSPVWTGVLQPGVPLIVRTGSRSELLVSSMPASP